MYRGNNWNLETCSWVTRTTSEFPTAPFECAQALSLLSLGDALVSTQAAITKYHRLSDLNNHRHLFLPVLEASSLRSGYQHGWVLVRAVFLASIWLPSHCVLTWWGGVGGEKDREKQTARSLLSLFIRTLISSWGPAFSWPHLKIIISWRPHHTGGYGFNIKNWEVGEGGTKFRP